jgi:hypothetical protein
MKLTPFLIGGTALVAFLLWRRNQKTAVVATTPLRKGPIVGGVTYAAQLAKRPRGQHHCPPGSYPYPLPTKSLTPQWGCAKRNGSNLL